MKKILFSVTLIIICIFAIISCKKKGGLGPSSIVDSVNIVPVIPNPRVTSPVINVYLENSGSMDGYVNGNTGFKQSIYYYLSELQGKKAASSINLFYINSKIISRGSDVKSFIHNTNPSTFKAGGGNLGTSDIAVVLDTLLSNRKNGEVSLFISDCIVSPGKAYSSSSPANIDSYLLQQRTDMTTIFRRELNRDKNLTVVICQLQSYFDGKFFNRVDQWRNYQGERPFYFWLIGDMRQIKSIIDKIPWSDFKGKGAEIENLYILTSPAQQVKYAIVNADCWGSFEREHSHSADASKTICKVKKESKGKNVGKFKFSIDVDFGSFPLDCDYLQNPDNYEIDNKDYTLEVKETNQGNFSHRLSLITNITSPCQMRVSLKNKFPDWVNEKTDSIGQDLVADKAENKTYGLSYLVEGVYKAFVDAKSSDDYARLTVTIK